MYYIYAYIKLIPSDKFLASSSLTSSVGLSVCLSLSLSLSLSVSLSLSLSLSHTHTHTHTHTLSHMGTKYKSKKDLVLFGNINVGATW